ncbi:uncharacterized protein DEA37_0007144 [Paragonimus westermani]|uniref:Uncharacterized protein n=1 Tax=Paragonimus westermani TaxID=34504 RepID=A0A5J4NVQ3_9TREM|nr:uncharacterized protein DEA37_0007144 [Paragonimus westermani]
MAELTCHTKRPPESMKDTFALLLKYSLQGRTRDLQRLIDSRTVEVRACVNRLNNAKLTAMHYAARNGQLGCLRLLVEKVNAGLHIVMICHVRTKFEITYTNETDHNPLKADGETNQGKSVSVNIGDESLDDIDEEFEWSDAEEPVAMPLLDGLSLPSTTTPRKQVQPKVCDPVIHFLVEHGAELNGQSENGWTALHYASVRGNEIAAKQLLQEPNIDFEVPDRDGMRPLHWAALRNETDIVTQLLIVKANLYARTKQGNLPMHFACATGNLKLIHLLISVTDDTDDNGCPLQLVLTNQDGESPLHWAVANGRTEVVKYCLEHSVDPNLTPATGETCLHMAARVGCLNTVKLLLSNNVNIDTEDMLLQTALHKAAELNNVEVVQSLLKRGADMENQDYNAYTPLLLAACKGHVQVVRILIDAGADMFAQELNSKGIVYLCAEENQTEVLELIVNQPQANQLVEMPNINNNFPLHVAAKKGHMEVIKMLIKHGANVTAKNEKERTALHYAAKYGQYKICRLLLKMIPSLVSEFDDDGNLAIHLAASQGHRDVTELLLASGAPIDVRNTSRMTPLDWAVTNGQNDCVTCLLEKGAPVNPVDRSNIPPLHLACKYGHVSTVKILMSWGADPAYRLNVDENTPNYGPNALDISIDHGQRQCAFALLREVNWEQALRNQTIGPDGLIQTPMRKLIIYMPDVAQLVLDRCVQVVNSRQVPAREMYIFEFLDDTYAHWCTDVILKEDRVNISVSPIGYLSEKLTNIQSKLFQLFFNGIRYLTLENLMELTIFSLAILSVIDHDDCYRELGVKPTFNEYSISHERSDAIFFSGVTYALFVTFLIVMSIVIMNLLVGLAVDDIKGVQNEAKIQRLAMQVQLILDIESLLPHWLRRYLVTDRLILDVKEPSDNQFWASPNRWVSHVRSRLPTAPDTQQYHQPDDEDTRRFQTRLRMLEERIGNLQAGQENLLSAINHIHEQLQLWHQEPSTISMEPPVNSE